MNQRFAAQTNTSHVNFHKKGESLEAWVNIIILFILILILGIFVLDFIVRHMAGGKGAPPLSILRNMFFSEEDILENILSRVTQNLS